MIARYYRKETDPGNMNNALKSVNGFVAGGGDYLYSSFTKIYGDIKEKLTKTPELLTDAQISEIKTAIDNGYPVMVKMDVNPKTVELDMHFVTIIGYNPADENDFTIADPLGGRKRSFKDYLGVYKPSVRRTIEAYLIYTGPIPALNSNTVVLSKDDAEKRTHNSEQWIKTVGYLGIEGDPTFTEFEAAQKVIAGIKSRATDFEKQAQTATGELAKRSQELENAQGQVSTLQKELLELDSTWKARYNALNESMPNFAKLEGQYLGEIKDLKAKLLTVEKERDDLKVAIAEIEAGTKTDNAIVSIMKNLLKLLEKIKK